MSSGGVRARSGPAPDLTALKRDRDGASWTVLPSAGRRGDVPAWPLTRATKRELAVWAPLWSRPQAVMWERNGQAHEVGMYVRTAVEAEQRGATASLRNLVLRQEENLGLSLPGLARNRWVIEGQAPAIEERARAAEAARNRPTGTDGASVTDIRSRLQGTTGG